MVLLDGKKIADAIIERLRGDIAELKKRGITPGLGIVLIGDNPASRLYVSMKQKTAEDLGMKCVLAELPASVSQEEARSAVEKMSSDSELHGIIVQLPLPKAFSQEVICSALAPAKDIDALNPATLERLKNGDAKVLPPTAEAVHLLIVASGRKLAGTHAAVIGSGFFATQIAYHLKNFRAVVDQVPFRSDDCAVRARAADIVVSVTGRGQSITGDYIKKRAVVIDVGVSRHGDEVVGDVLFEDAKKRASAITPVPGGVGPVTVACLLENVVHAARISLT